MAQTFLLDGPEAALRLKGAVCAVGVFDGVHVGHVAVARRAVAAAAESGVPSAIVTFDVDPDELFAAEGARKLQSNDERIAMLAQLPVDYVAAIPFTRQFAALPPAAFLDDVLGRMEPSRVLVGSACWPSGEGATRSASRSWTCSRWRARLPSRPASATCSTMAT